MAVCAKDCATAGLAVELKVSAPANGNYFAAGEKPVLTIKIKNANGDFLAPTALGTANLYIAGPREPEDTKAAVKLMNATVDRAAADRQHHTIYLNSPKFADPSQNNLKAANDGSYTFTMGAVSDEMPGTYTAGIWGVSPDLIDQVFALADFQVGTATVETYVSGPIDSASCLKCHTGPQSGKTYMAHILPGFSPFGNYALDSKPIGDCKLCHNNDGYSANPIVRKVHGAHRGEHMTNPGVAHPEYGLNAADTTLAEFTNVAYPSFPDGEKDCASCHTDDRWKTEPSRMACGTCHDNVFFDTGKIDPPHVLGACKSTADCPVALSTCNTGTGFCEQATHPTQADDSQCVTCHPAAGDGLAPVAVVHAIASREKTRGLTMSDVALSGASGPNGSFKVGDTVTVTFSLKDKSGNVIADLKTNAALSASAIIAGPTDAPQRVVGDPVNVKTAGTLAFDSGSGKYTYTMPAAIPAQPLVPLNGSPADQGASNPDGTYMFWIWVNETITQSGVQFRDAANGVVNFALGADAPLQPRQVIMQAACDSCHVVTQAHGGGRQRADTCWACHNTGAMDRTVGARGLACKTDNDCPGHAAGWESCQDTTSDGTPDTCVITTDPTPGVTINFPVLIHSIHFSRLRENWLERTNVDKILEYIGFRNTVVQFTEVLFPQDVRNCQKCHGDAGNTCSASAPCGAGQTCVSGKCQNDAWKTPTHAAVCLACHDAPDAVSHAGIMTFNDPVNGPVETCSVCHDPGADFAVEKVHNISTPYQPPYPRTKE